MKDTRIILHIDLDAFFASCEERENPHFRGKPIVVGANPHSPAGKGRGRGVVSTANYEARKYGIHSAMPISRAWKLCPDAIFLPVNGSLYSRVSKSVMAILSGFAKKYNGKFEQTSIDEAYLDLSGFLRYSSANPSSPIKSTRNSSQIFNFSPPEADQPRLKFSIFKLAKHIKKEICSREKITASVGAGPNMLIAKIASDFRKPNGLTIITLEKAQEFLDPLDIRKIPGIGPKTEALLRKLGVSKVSELRSLEQSYLYDLLGEHGVSLYEAARGNDKREVGTKHETKSISNDHTFSNDVGDLSKILPEFFPVVKRVIELAKAEGFEKFRTITVRVRFSDFKTHTKSQSGIYGADNPDNIEREALRLLWKFIPHSADIASQSQSRKKIRLIGFRVSNFF